MSREHAAETPKALFMAAMNASLKGEIPEDELADAFDQTEFEHYQTLLTDINPDDYSSENPFRMIDIGCGENVRAFAYVAAVFGHHEHIRWLGIDPAAPPSEIFEKEIKAPGTPYLQLYKGVGADIEKAAATHPDSFNKEQHVDLVVMNRPVVQIFPITGEQAENLMVCFKEWEDTPKMLVARLLVELNKLARDPANSKKTLLNEWIKGLNTQPNETLWSIRRTGLLAIQGQTTEHCLRHTVPTVMHDNTHLLIQTVENDEKERVANILKERGFEYRQGDASDSGLSSGFFLINTLPTKTATVDASKPTAPDQAAHNVATAGLFKPAKPVTTQPTPVFSHLTEMTAPQTMPRLTIPRTEANFYSIAMKIENILMAIAKGDRKAAIWKTAEGSMLVQKGKKHFLLDDSTAHVAALFTTNSHESICDRDEGVRDSETREKVLTMITTLQAAFPDVSPADDSTAHPASPKGGAGGSGAS